MTGIIEIEGIGPASEAKLKTSGIETVEALLREGGTRVGRGALAAKTGLDEVRILQWVNRADLMRVKGVGSEFSDLLEASGVDTVRELAQRNAENLHAKLLDVNKAKNLVNRAPSMTEVESWIRQAADMKAGVSY
jgi:predicted flap endonuclease-1-like 5' DNA nuclease